MKLNNSDYTFNIIGEDISWSKRVQDVGFKIYADPQVKVTHHKMTTLDWRN
jgi:GT2 family glycosyltransferase